MYFLFIETTFNYDATLLITFTKINNKDKF